MSVCEQCRREFASGEQRCPDCGRRTTRLRDVDSWDSYLAFSNRVEDQDRHEVDSGASRLPGWAARGLDLLSYLVALLVAGYGVAGITAGYWLGGGLAVLSATFLTAAFRRAVGSHRWPLLAFVVVFVVGRSSPSTWLL